MTGNRYFDGLLDTSEIAAHSIKWREQAGMGYLQLFDTPYDEAYFQKYVEMSETPMGSALTEARIDLVNKYRSSGALVDIGIGSGDFMLSIGCFGYDINPVAVEHLEIMHLLHNPYLNDIECATFWDSLEHIQDIAAILIRVKQYAFVSLPIFKNLGHILTSKHYRPDEHAWYFTDDGFHKFMDAHGFKVVEQNQMETDLGREDIGTYVCKRVN